MNDAVERARVSQQASKTALGLDDQLKFLDDKDCQRTGIESSS